MGPRAPKTHDHGLQKKGCGPLATAPGGSQNIFVGPPHPHENLAPRFMGPDKCPPGTPTQNPQQQEPKMALGLSFCLSCSFSFCFSLLLFLFLRLLLLLPLLLLLILLPFLLLLRVVLPLLLYLLLILLLPLSLGLPILSLKPLSKLDLLASWRSLCSVLTCPLKGLLTSLLPSLLTLSMLFTAALLDNQLPPNLLTLLILLILTTLHLSWLSTVLMTPLLLLLSLFSLCLAGTSSSSTLLTRVGLKQNVKHTGSKCLGAQGCRIVGPASSELPLGLKAN